MKKVRCIDCKHSINLYLDYEGYLHNGCEIVCICFNSIEKWYCLKYIARDNKAKIRTIKGYNK